MDLDIDAPLMAATRWPFFVFLAGAMFCLLSSSTCHLFGCHSHHLNLKLLQLDYVGITVMIITSFFPPIYYIFQCNPLWQFIYLGGVTTMGVFTIMTLLSPKLSSGKYRSFRAVLFMAMGLFGLIPSIHACILKWDEPQRNATLVYESVMALSYLTGTMFYVTRIPERWLPGWFDLAGHSHQIFHCFVIMGALAHYGAAQMFIESWGQGGFFAFWVFGIKAMKEELHSLGNVLEEKNSMKATEISDSALRFVKKARCDSLAFCLGKTLPVSKPDCVLCQDCVTFCLEDLLRFVSRPLRFVSRLSCVLSQDLLRFVSRLTAFCLQSVAFCLQASCVLSTSEDLFLSFDTRPPMLDRTDFASWQQRIRLYCRGKENGVNILKSIDEEPYQMGTVWETLAESTEGAPQFGHKYIASRVTKGHLHLHQSLLRALAGGVAFRKHSCYVRDTDGVDLIKGSRGSNLYTISVEDMMKSSPICLLSKVSKNKSWLWHRCLNHLNFGTINDLARKDLVRGLPRLKFEKDHICSACQLGKSKKHTHKPKTKNTNLEVLHTIHMDLCGPMRVQTINEKKYILVTIDDYFRFTWVKLFRSKDETPEVIIKFIQQIQVGLNKTVRYVRTDNGTEFVNHTLTEYYKRIDIFHQKTAESVATACYTQNRSLIHTRHHKTPYELVHNKKPDLTFFRVFGALCYPTNDSEDLGKLQRTADIGIFVSYAPSRKGTDKFRPRTKPGSCNSLCTPINKELEILFQPMFDEYLEPPRVDRPVLPAPAVQASVNSASTPSSTTIDRDAPSPSISPSSSALQSHSLHQGVAAEPNYIEVHNIAPVDNNLFVNVFALEPHSEASSSGDISSTE
nr:heptahelical transmembrane protein 1-like [Tanacetum cinerariifolium]